eukprot:1818982-Pyramimonas_sp.AAC.2
MQHASSAGIGPDAVSTRGSHEKDARAEAPTRSSAQSTTKSGRKAELMQAIPAPHFHTLCPSISRMLHSAASRLTFRRASSRDGRAQGVAVARSTYSLNEIPSHPSTFACSDWARPS